ncbi:hypothetical protein PG995_008724 [Apiospora arundinis]
MYFVRRLSTFVARHRHRRRSLPPNYLTAAGHLDRVEDAVKQPQKDGSVRLAGHPAVTENIDLYDQLNHEILIATSIDVKDVDFKPKTMYARKPKKREDVQRLVVLQAPVGAVSATVMSVWHVSPSDPRLHCTVDYVLWNGLVRRKHVYEEYVPA